MSTAAKTAAASGADLLVKSLEAQGVKYVFGVPGAKIDKVFDSLLDSKIQTVVCRHEQNAAFIAGGIGRMTGRAGVALVTSGPGCSNLVTGLATANSEGDPVVGIGGAAPVADRLKLLHQNMDTVDLFRPITKFSAEIDSSSAIPEVVANAFRAAETGRPGAAFISAPKDIMSAGADGSVLTPNASENYGPADHAAITDAAKLIKGSKLPVLFLGLHASSREVSEAVRSLIAKTQVPVVCTYQGAGVVARDQFDRFAGRVGLFRTEAGDKLLDAADLVITVGYDPIEYEPGLWNLGKSRKLIHIDVLGAEIDKDYRPTIELVGNVAATVSALTGQLGELNLSSAEPFLQEAVRDRAALAAEAEEKSGTPIHPLRLVHELQKLLSDDTTVCCDMGSFHIWLARHLYSFRPRQILMTNGQQTLGVGLPWGIAASLVRPGEKVISISGDGGLLFSIMELETAVRLKCNLVHVVWIDGHYDMVKFQEVAKYGRSSGVDFGPVDILGLAEAFGAKGLKVEAPEQIATTLKKALATPGPVLVAVPVDYRDNHKLMEIVHPDALN